MARNNDATLEWARSQLALLVRVVDEVYQHELSHDVGSPERRAGIDGAQKLMRSANETLRATVQAHPVALRNGRQWEPGDPMPCSRCQQRRVNYLVSPEGFILCLRCVPRSRLVVR